MYATYSFYVNDYYGSIISEEDFDKYATRASDYIDYLTMGKAANYSDTTDALKKACCAVAEQIDISDKLETNVSQEYSASVGAIASETVGSHSVSFRSGVEMHESLSASMLSAAQMYLLQTGLLYRGVPCIRRIP